MLKPLSNRGFPGRSDKSGSGGLSGLGETGNQFTANVDSVAYWVEVSLHSLSSNTESASVPREVGVR